MLVRRIWTLVALMAVVAGGYVFLRHDAAKQAEAQAHAAEAANLFACPRLDHVVEVRLTGPQGDITLARRARPPASLPAASDANLASAPGVGDANGQAHAQATAKALQTGEVEGSWHLVTPLATPAEHSTVQAMLQATCALQQLGPNIVVHEGRDKAADPNAFGLTPPQFTLSLRALDGTTQVLEAGRKSAFDGSIYVRRKGEQAVRRVDSSFAFQLERSVFSLREKRLLSVEPEDVAQLELTSFAPRGVPPPAPYTLARDGNGWRLTHGASAHDADPTAVRTLLAALTQARAKFFVDEAPDAHALAHYGLAHPNLMVALQLRDGRHESLRLGRVHLGRVDHDFAQGTQVAGPVAELPSTWLYDKLARGAEELRDMRLLRLDADKVASFVVQDGDGAAAARLGFVRVGSDALPLGRRPFALDAQSEARVAKADRARLDGVKVATTLTRLADLRADTFAATKAPLAAPQLVVTFADEAGATLATLRVGAKVGPHRLVQGNAQPQLGHAFAAALEGIDASPASWLEAPAAAAAP